jgi:hypothetical protein
LNGVTADYDGNLPDTMNHTTATTSGGWAPLEPEMLIYRWNLNIDASGWPIESGGTFCLDSIAHANSTYNWLWLPASDPFGGPYCADFWKPANQSPQATCPTTDITVQWDQQASASISVTDPEDNAIVDATASLGDVTTAGAWTFNPDCGDVGSHTVTVCFADGSNPCPNDGECSFTLTVLNTAPTFTNCPTETFNVSIVGDASFDLDASDANVGDVLTFSVTDACASVDANGVVTLDGACVGTEGAHDVDVTVTDCHGDTDVCTVHFYVVSELPYDIVIDKVHDQLQGHYALVDVIKTAGSNDMHGFDFLIAYDASALSFMGAVPGVLFDMTGDYQWEYFTYRFGPFGNCDGGCPSGMLRVVGIADQNDGPHNPLSKSVPDGTVLFQLNFMVSNDRTLECQYVPIRFFWMDCGDNTIAYHSSTSFDDLSIEAGVSDKVFAYGVPPTEITDSTILSYPTYYGWQNIEECQPLPGKPAPIRFVNFYNGGIDIVCADSIDARGDINLNGISNEIADAVVFTNYFIYGLAAFTVDVPNKPEGQIAATDVNADGIVLSVADLVYLIRVIVGDALPYPKLAPAGDINFTLIDNKLTTEAELGAALFVFDGNVAVSAAGGFEIKSDYVNGQTRTLVYSMDAGVTISGNVLNTSAMPVSIEAVDYYGQVYNTAVVPSTFGLTNYPNPFNPTTVMSMDLPTESDWTIEIFNVAGQKVAEFSGHDAPGTVNVEWNATDVASGIYFYRGTASGMSATEKMVLLK